jgi:hypothetical protein
MAQELSSRVEAHAHGLMAHCFMLTLLPTLMLT